jgi:C-terminal processing protease CtpA/Prc
MRQLSLHPPEHRLTINSICLLICLLTIFRIDGFAQSTPSQPPSGLVNLDFEQGDLGQIPTGWFSPTKKLGYTAKLTDENPKSGKQCALLYSESEVKPDINGFGNLMQVIDAMPYRGKRVRFRAAVRTEADEGARIQLWLRVDRDGGRVGFFDNMQDRPIASREWQLYEIVGDVDPDAKAINFGVLLIGRGKAWLDSVSLDDLGKPVVLAEPPRPLTDKAIENLTAFTRLLGYVRHFHPSDEAATADWETFAVDGVRSVEQAATATELAQKLEEIFRPIAPTVRVFPTGKSPALPPGLDLPANEPSLKIVSWKHKGFGSKTKVQSTYRSERVSKEVVDGKIPEKGSDPRKPFVADLGGGVSCLVPLALFANAKGTLPHRTSSPTGPEMTRQVKYSGNDRATRLADVALAWNVFQHFYPYFDVVQTDWAGTLAPALKSAATDADETAFLRTLRRLVAALHDGHGGVYHSSESATHAIPVLWEWLEGKLVITHVAPEGAGGLQPGDIVLEIDGKPTADALAEAQSAISGATPQWKRFLALLNLRMGAHNSEVKLSAQTGSGSRTSVVLRRSMEFRSLQEPRPPKIDEVKPGVFYIDLDRIKDEDFKAALPKLEKATGIVFDLRGYPKVSPALLSHLTDKPIQSARWNVPIITTPDHKDLTEYDTGGRWNLAPQAPRITAKMAFLTDGRAISYAESYLGIIEAYKLAEIVGETTAGTNGNNNPFTLPGGYRVTWTGMKVLKHDGSQHHGIGIQPTVRVSRTIRGVAEKRDEQLERAISLVSQ